MSNVKAILSTKSGELWSVSPEDIVLDAIRLMADKNVGALTVMHNDELVGIISERDYTRKVILKERSSSNTKVKDIMSKQVYYTHPEQSIDECMFLMTEHRIRHLPVLENTKLVGMISVGDVVKEIINDQKYTIKQLENYISWEENY
ncbi:MAG: CBS domain-containing protein [Gammaproteobacteria bacterium]|nr:CBS domain-containing protein [Gammaproteobacteria bacterium]